MHRILAPVNLHRLGITLKLGLLHRGLEFLLLLLLKIVFKDPEQLGVAGPPKEAVGRRKLRLVVDSSCRCHGERLLSLELIAVGHQHLLIHGGVDRRMGLLEILLPVVGNGEVLGNDTLILWLGLKRDHCDWRQRLGELVRERLLLRSHCCHDLLVRELGIV